MSLNDSLTVIFNETLSDVMNRETLLRIWVQACLEAKLFLGAHFLNIKDGLFLQNSSYYGIYLSCDSNSN